MPLSRLRLRMAAWFAVAFVAALTVLHLLLYAYLRHESNRRLTTHLYAHAVELMEFVQREHDEHPAAGLEGAVRETLIEVPPRPGAFVVYAGNGVRVGERGDSIQLLGMPSILGAADTAVRDVNGPNRHSFRQVTVAGSGPPAFFVRASGSTLPIREESEALAMWLIGAVPVVLTLGLAAGYLLSRRALTPVVELEQAVAAIAPETLNRRLPVGRVPDEIDQLALQFNSLLERLEQAQRQNRRFVQQAAHQIRTPLTLVLGEADLSLDRPRTSSERQEALERIRTAAGQMKRRVDELFLLAQAEAGERPALDEVVELDGLVLECADLMRSRARQLDQRLELGRVEAVSVRGNEALLKEAVLELIENACRHGSNEHPIGISAYSDHHSAFLTVASAGALPQAVATGDSNEPRGVGLTVVRWIASEHGGVLTSERSAGFNLYRLTLASLQNGDSPV